MNLAVGILTFNQLSNGRRDAFRATVRSLVDQDYPMSLYLVDNHSTDGTADYVASLGGTCLTDPISTCGHGMNATIGLLAASGADVAVFSNDDISWRPGALQSLASFWAEAPDDVLIAAGLLEEDFPWNTPRQRIECGGVAGLVRDSVPGGAWTLRARDWAKIRPLPEAPGWDDVPTCERLRRKGYRVVSLDLATHLGAEVSTWGNGSKRYEKPLDREAWNLERTGSL